VTRDLSAVANLLVFLLALVYTMQCVIVVLNQLYVMLYYIMRSIPSMPVDSRRDRSASV